ncbi:MAG: hypothetical protein WAO07_17990 [Desulfobacterales bacterium]
MEPVENEKHNMYINPGVGVMIEDALYGYRYPASLYDCDKDEMYIEANFAPRTGSKFSIIFDNQGCGVAPQVCHAVILWRKLLCAPDSSWSYGLGIKHI